MENSKKQKGGKMSQRTFKPKRIYYKPQFVAEIFDVSVKTIYGWIKERKLPYVKISGSIRIPQDRFEKWIEDRTIIPHD